MTLKTKILVSLVALVVAFASGRYSVQKPTIKTEIQQTEAVKQTEDKNTHTKTTKTEVKKPDGTDITTTVTDQVQDDDMTTHSTATTKIQQTVTPPKTGTLNISALAGFDIRKMTPAYGASVTKQILGPVSVGAFGLTNGVVGVSIGLSF